MKRTIIIFSIVYYCKHLHYRKNMSIRRFEKPFDQGIIHVNLNKM